MCLLYVSPFIVCYIVEVTGGDADFVVEFQILFLLAVSMINDTTTVSHLALTPAVAASTKPIQSRSAQLLSGENGRPAVRRLALLAWPTHASSPLLLPFAIDGPRPPHAISSGLWSSNPMPRATAQQRQTYRASRQALSSIDTSRPRDHSAGRCARPATTTRATGEGHKLAVRSFSRFLVAPNHTCRNTDVMSSFEIRWYAALISN